MSSECGGPYPGPGCVHCHSVPDSGAALPMSVPQGGCHCGPAVGTDVVQGRGGEGRATSV